MNELKMELQIDAESVFCFVKKLSMEDREVLEKGSVAFVSFVSGYKEHHCNYIFQWTKMDYGKLANGFGLLFVRFNYLLNIVYLNSRTASTNA
jgi:ATP-dependent RNA helicase DDX55/SPB4